MKRSLLILCFSISMLSGCIYSGITFKTDANIKKVALGMDRERVIQILGTDYAVSSSYKDDTGNHIEVLTYRSNFNEEYKLRFVNTQLIEWNRDLINKYIVNGTTPVVTN